jgi:hypothetical protein
MKITEITRPRYQRQVDNILQKAGYKRLGYGSFGAVYDKGDKIIKIFTSKDSAYLAFVSMVLKHKDNPHFPKMYGKPIKISDEYYGIKMEKLEVGEVNPEHISEYINNIKHGISDDDINPKIIKFIKSQGEKFEEACSLIAEILKSNSHFKVDMYSGNENLLKRGNTIVFIDPIYDEDKIFDRNLPNIGMWEDKKILKNSLKNWFDEKWVDISRKENGKHPECGASAGKGRRKKSSKAAYPKCVKKSKADSMTKKEKESASRRKRDTERKSSGSKINMVKTDT